MTEGGMRTTRIFGFVAIGAATALFGVAQAARPAGKVARPPAAGRANGKQVFARWCAECHAAGPGHPGTQSLQVKYQGETPAVLTDRADLTPEVTAYFVRNGVSLMPFFRKTEISDRELRDLSAYLAKGK
jgi:mono/diheme cytochrome c family protein